MPAKKPKEFTVCPRCGCRRFPTRVADGYVERTTSGQTFIRRLRVTTCQHCGYEKRRMTIEKTEEIEGSAQICANDED